MEKTTNNAWKISTPTIMVLGFAGILTGRSIYFTAAIIPIFILLTSYISRNPDLSKIEIEREITKEAPIPGEKIQINLKITNNGQKTFTDLRIIDQVPEQLKVTRKSPRAAITLQPGKQKTINYQLTAKRGKHVFQKTKIETRKGKTAITQEIQPGGDDQIECKTDIKDIPLRDKTIEQTGDITTSKAGNGLEFHSLREYKPTDPPSRVEWEHLAKTGKLATKNFREEKAGNIVIVLDAQRASDIKPEPGHPTGVDLSAYAAARIYKNLIKSRQKPGLIALGISNDQIDFTTDSAIIPYIEPGRTRQKRRKTQEILKEAQKTHKINEKDIKSKLYKILPPNSQIIFLTPLLEDSIVDSIKTLEQHGHPSTVITPNITYKNDTASRIENIKREIRINKLRSTTPVIDWNPDQKMDLQLNKALKKLYKRR